MPQGALHMLNECKPKLHISLYHNAQHYFSIPIFLMNHFPDYKYYMGHSSAWFNETVLYATPPASASKEHTYEPDEHTDNLCEAYLAAGKKVVFVGCGASYKRHRPLSALTPVAFAVDEYYQASLPTMIDGIPVKATMTADEKQPRDDVFCGTSSNYWRRLKNTSGCSPYKYNKVYHRMINSIKA